MEPTTENTLILAVCRRGHTDAVMATAKAHGARGGTVIKGRLSGSEALEQAYGLNLTPEREVVAIVVPRDKRGPIMDAVNTAHGLRQEAQTILCALPIDHIVRLGYPPSVLSTLFHPRSVPSQPGGAGRGLFFGFLPPPGSTSGSPPRCPPGR